jgi:predicted chitinase
MSTETRKRAPLPGPGPFLAEVTSHLDVTFMGGLEVALVKNVANNTKNKNETYTVKYLNPFYGVTSIRYEGTNSGDFNDVQKSYGMWMVPPDIGTTVMVIFIDGDPNQGYWMGCVQDLYQNHMVPGIAATRFSSLTDEQRRKYGTDYLPTAEFLKAGRDLSNPNVDRFSKPVHPFADRLLQQGLLLDATRGVSSSSARREAPSSVFGISTPGPLDTSSGAKKALIGYEDSDKKDLPVSRLGGTTFVMDDGDSEGQNELVRIRTRTGHQILFHNSQDLIYIANSKGTAWIELTSNGKIDIYAKDSVSIHTEADFNFRADRDINFEAVRNINIRAGKNMETNVTGYHYLTVDGDQKIAVRGNQDETVGQTIKLSVGNNYNLSVAENLKLTTAQNFDVTAGAEMRLGSAGNFNLGSSGNVIVTGSQIHANGPAAATPTTADIAEIPPDLPLFSLPNRKVEEGWANSKFYESTPIKSIMQRVPTHEPWSQHENVNPVQFSSQATDVTLADRSANGIPPNPVAEVQEPANVPEIPPGTCSADSAKPINDPAAQAGIQSLKEAAAELGLTNPNAVASLLGIAGGECAWKPGTENFNYRSPDRLLQVFPSVFKGDRELASKYTNNPKELPEFLYGANTAKGRDLGNTRPGDGEKFIGRGYIQLTGRANYEKYSKLMHEKGLIASPTTLVDNPDLLNDPKIAAQVSVLYFQNRVKVSQDDPGYFESAAKAVGYNTADIKAKKTGYYECFKAQLTASALSSGTGGIVTDADGNPLKLGGQ